MCGGGKRFYALPKERRTALRAHARELYEAGADFVTASLRTDVVEGFVYIITHPSWPEFVKIGCAINPESRLGDYQTYCPRRAYSLEHYVYTTNRRASESHVHQLFANQRAAGEWFHVPVDAAITALNAVAELDFQHAA